ncbi:AtpC1 [Desulforapulum autotrophicum HRM2]|uniref:AtpC1 n=1 Tax=Desulforapulum autotrophicum (strain ATCC 43914 / DSM 3382 / VKM B-1955 / HRM2) TaxID=177437 RepID=C0Q8V9_DESAH|nr:protein AtpC1 [Desulforapulum autotrophicum]ACN14449.1 AtpC1 [Desulforapulum autotrophicum HRM2]
MQISINLPTSLYFSADKVLKIVAEGMEGYFTLLPNHIDYVSILVPSILTVEIKPDTPVYFAVDHATLVKKGSRVWISTRNVVRGKAYETLAQVVLHQFKEISEMEKKSRTALTGLEYGLLRRFAALKHP